MSARTPWEEMFDNQIANAIRILSTQIEDWDAFLRRSGLWRDFEIWFARSQDDLDREEGNGSER